VLHLFQRRRVYPGAWGPRQALF